MKKTQVFKLLLLLFAITWFIPSFAQLKRGGTPPSFATPNKAMLKEQDVKSLQAPDLAPLKAEDEIRAKSGLMPRVSKILQANYTMENSGEWITLDTGEKVWQLRLKSSGAIALSLYYDRFYLPEGSKLFIYSANKKHVVGAFTAADNPQFGPEFATEMIAGDELILEYVAPAGIGKLSLGSAKGAVISSAAKEQLITKSSAKGLSKGGGQPVISISGVGYIYNDKLISVAKSFYDPAGPGLENQSGECMININCPEGGAWQDQKKGVAATIQRIAGGGWVCSGTLLNNTAQDGTPYFLMAFHCSVASGQSATAAELNQWLFYFHFERTACDNNSPVAGYRAATGAQRLVATDINGASDGLLLRLNQDIGDFGVYYNGWNRTNTPLSSGVSIHHPAGDLKKISYVNTPATHATWSSAEGVGAANAHWSVAWGAVNGKKGVTEGGSSGSPLFDQNGLVVGSLSGGNGGNTNPCNANTISLYGKLWWHWDQSPDPNQRMAKYLDPAGLGVTSLNGMYGASEVVAGFIASDTSIYIMESIDYKDASTLASTWEWTFEGGTPSSYIGRTPPSIKYNTLGTFTTTFTINKGTASEKTATKIITVAVKDKLIEEVSNLGSPTTLNAPLGTLLDNYRIHRSAMLYHKEELEWMKGAGAITSLAWQKKADDPHPRNIKIWLKHYASTATDLGTANTVAHYSALLDGAKLVVEATGFTNTIGYCEFPFNRGDKQFAYHPDSSLLILVETDYGDDRAMVKSVTPARTMENHTKAYAEKADGTQTTDTVHSRPVVRISYKVTPAAPVADFTVADAAGIFSEKFDANQFPAGWTIEKTGASDNKWMLGNVMGIDFSSIDPDNKNSAVISWDSDYMVDSKLISPVISIPATSAPKVSFYMLWGDKYAPAGMVKFYISEDNGATWVEKWANTYEDATVWRQVILDIREYAGKAIQLSWRYAGLDMDGVGVDNVMVNGARDTSVTIYEGGNVLFTDRSSGPPISWQWSLPGATPATSKAAGFTATYPKAGTYDVSLTVASDLGTHTKTAGAVIVKKLPLESATWKSSSNGYTIYPHSGQFLPVGGGTVQFEDVSLVKPDTWTWALSGATPASATGNAPKVLYQAGKNTYGVKLKIANNLEEKEQEIPDYVKVGGASDIWNVAGGETPTELYSLFGLAITGVGFFSETSERFAASKAGVVSKVRVYTKKVTQDAAASMTVALYSDNKGLPETLLSPVMTVPGGSIAEDGYNTVTFPAPVGVPEAFHVVVGSTDPDVTMFGVTSVERRAAYNTVNVYDYGSWYSLYEYFGYNLSMNIVPEFTFTEFTMTSKDTVKKKHVDSTETTVTFETDAATWTATADSWINLGATGGTSASTTLTFTVADNILPEFREGAVTIHAGGVQAVTTVLQGGDAPQSLKAGYNDENKSVKLTWKDAFNGIFDDFESHTPLVINSPGTVGWTYIDGDGQDIYSGYFQGALTGKMAFAVLEFDPASGVSHSGARVLVCPPLPGLGEANDDWIISPLLNFAASYSVPSFTFSFWAKSNGSDSLERIRVAYSTAGNAKSDFTHVLTTEPCQKVPGEWTKYSFTIPVAAKYVALNCISQESDGLLVDDIAIGIGIAPASAPARSALSAPADATEELTPARDKTEAKGQAAVDQSAKANVKLKRVPVKKQLASPLKESMNLQSLAPGDKKVIRWDDGKQKGTIGVDDGGYLEVAAKWEPADLKDYKNASVQSVEIAIGHIGANMVLKIWQGGKLVHSQPIKIKLPASNFNTFELVKPLPIDVTKDLMVGYGFTQVGDTDDDYVPGTDDGPAVAGKGDLISLDDGKSFEALSSYGINYNWNIAVTLVGGTPSILYNVYRDGKLIAENVNTKEYEDKDTKTTQSNTVCYTVTAIYNEDPFFESDSSNKACLYSKGYLTVGVKDTAKLEASENPVFTAVIKEGALLPEHDATTVLALVKFATLANSLSPAGTYTIMPVLNDIAASTYTDSYVFVAAPGVLAITGFPTDVTRQPVGAVVCEGGNHTFSIASTGLDVKYQLQKEVKGVWTNINTPVMTSGTATSTTYTFNHVTVDDAGRYRILANGRSDKRASDVIILRVGLPAAGLIVYPWSDVLAVSNNPAENGGYSFEKFQWIHDGTALNGTTHPYLHVPKGSAATYEVYLTTSDGLPLAVCPFIPQLSAASLAVYPNPVMQGAPLTVQSAGLPKGSVANIYNSTGTLVKGNLPLSGTQSALDIGGLAHGIYVLQIAQPDGSKQAINIVVN